MRQPFVNFVGHLKVAHGVGADLFDSLTALVQRCVLGVKDHDLFRSLQESHVDPQLETAAIMPQAVAAAFGPDAAGVQSWAETELEEKHRQQ